MRGFALSHVSDFELHLGLASLVAQDRATTAMLLAHIAEFDARRLYLPAAYPSMYAYCVHELHLSEDAAFKRITAARVARRFPVIFEALADGRLHLAAVGLLAPHLTPGNATELLAQAAHRTKSQIEELIAGRFPRSEAFGLVQILPGSPSLAGPQPAVRPVASGSPERCDDGANQLAPGRVEAEDSKRFETAAQLAARQVGSRTKVTPVAADRFLLQATIGRSTHDKLQHARDLLGHQLPSGELAQVLDRALDALIEKLEKRKPAATRQPRPSRRPGKGPRHIPAHVKRAVWKRDEGQCTFVSQSGRRCCARKFLEFDHVEPVARGGRAALAGLRLRCRAHNQYGAECMFGAEFMRRKRDDAKQAAMARRQKIETRPGAAIQDVIAPLRQLGFSAGEARRAATLCETIPEASLEQRVRCALTYFQPRGRVSVPIGGTSAG